MFTVEEANELVPDLELAFGRLGRLDGRLGDVLSRPGKGGARG